jgi:hypothetical protein
MAHNILIFVTFVDSSRHLLLKNGVPSHLRYSTFPPSSPLPVLLALYISLFFSSLFFLFIREFLALEQSLKRFGAKPLRQPPTTSANNNNTSNNNSGSNSGRGFSGFKSLSPFLKGNSSSAPASPSSSSFLRRNTGGSSGHLVGSTLTSLAEEEPPSHERGQSDEPSYNRGNSNGTAAASTPGRCASFCALAVFAFEATDISFL